MAKISLDEMNIEGLTADGWSLLVEQEQAHDDREDEELENVSQMNDEQFAQWQKKVEADREQRVEESKRQIEWAQGQIDWAQGQIDWASKYMDTCRAHLAQNIEALEQWRKDTAK